MAEHIPLQDIMCPPRTLSHDHDYGIGLSPWSALRLGLTTEHPGDVGSMRHITVGDEGLYVIAAHDGA